MEKGLSNTLFHKRLCCPLDIKLEVKCQVHAERCAGARRPWFFRTEDKKYYSGSKKPISPVEKNINTFGTEVLLYFGCEVYWHMRSSSLLSLLLPQPCFHQLPFVSADTIFIKSKLTVSSQCFRSKADFFSSCFLSWRKSGLENCNQCGPSRKYGNGFHRPFNQWTSF